MVSFLERCEMEIGKWHTFRKTKGSFGSLIY